MAKPPTLPSEMTLSKAFKPLNSKHTQAFKVKHCNELLLRRSINQKLISGKKKIHTTAQTKLHFWACRKTLLEHDLLEKNKTL
jgi:hypothetical protein